MSPAETLSVLGALAFVALLYLYPPARAPAPSPRRRRARQNPPQAHPVVTAPVAVPPRRTVSRPGSFIDVDALPGPSSSLGTRARSDSTRVPHPAPAGPVAGPSQPTVVIGTATQLMSELGARAMSPFVHTLVTVAEPQLPSPRTPTPGPSRRRLPSSAPTTGEPSALSPSAGPSSPVDPPPSLPSTPAGPSTPRVPAYPSGPVEPSTPSDVGEGSTGRDGSSAASRPILNGSPISRVRREVTPRKSKAVDKVEKVVTYYWKSQASGTHPIQTPPDLSKDPELALGDVFYYPMVDIRFQLWLWTSRADGPPYWKAIRYGYKRADGRRIVVTPFYKVPGWVEKYDKVDHAMRQYDAYIG